MNTLSKYLISGGIILLLVLSSCTNDDDKKTIVCWGDSLTASHTNGTGYKGMVKGVHFKKEGYRIIARLVKQNIDRFK